MAVLQRLRGRMIAGYLGSGRRALSRRARQVVRRGRPTVELFYEAGDPYSHLLVQTLAPLLRADVELLLHVVPPPQPPVDPEPTLRVRYAMRDAVELAAAHDLAFPHEPAEPTAARVTQVNAILGRERDIGEQLDVARRVGDLFWSGADLTSWRDAEGADAVATEALLERNDTRRRRLGHYQGSMLWFEGEWYWGVDRLTHLEARLQSEGIDVGPLLRPPIPGPPIEADALEMFYSFRSPYSYLALERAREIARQHDLPLRIRPVLPMVMRGYRVPLAKRLYIARDCAREAERLGIPFGNLCDPLGPGIDRCMALFAWAEERDKGYDLALSVGRGAWAEARDIGRDDELAQLVERAGLPWSEARERLDDTAWREQARENRAALLSLGMWGVPSFKLGSFSIWGQDRLERISSRLR